MLYQGLQLGRYRLLRLIGRGGAGQVYIAEDQRLMRQVALKVVQIEDPSSEEAKSAARLFQREAQTIAMLNHPNILPLFDFGEETIDGVTLVYLVTPFCPEGSLAAWLRRDNGNNILPPYLILHIVQQAAVALEYAHDKDIIHRDVKPSNFLIRRRKDTPDRPDLLLADFGIARLTQSTADVSKTIRGTPKYMAPEHWNGNPAPASDQYSLAIMTYELLAGRLPFLGTQDQVMYQHIMTQPQPVSAFNSAIPAAIDTVILRALSKQPEARFPSITGFAHAFQRAMQPVVETSNVPVISPPASSPYVATLTPSLTPSMPKETPHISTPHTVQSNDIYTTLTISTAEAQVGVNRTITLPGKQLVKVAVPAGVYDGQVIRLEGQVEAPSPNTPKGNLIVTIAVAPRAEPAAKAEPVVKVGSATKAEVAPKAEPVTKPESAIIEDIPGLPRPRINGRIFLLFGLVLLILLGGIAAFSFLGTNRTSPNPTNAAHSSNTGITIASQATSSAATASAAAQATATAQINATAILTANPYDSSLRTLALNESLEKNSNSRWNETSGRCTFNTGGYHVISQPQDTTPQICTALSTNFSDLTFQVQMNILRGNAGGILFRSTGSASYYFRISDDGKYALLTCAANGTACNQTLTSGFSSYIATGQNKPNLIAVVARGNDIELYVNNAYVDGVKDSSSLHGQIGVVAEVGSEIVFSNAKVWTP